MALPKLPTAALDDINHQRRHREVTNLILNHQHDDSRVRTAAEVSAGVTPVNYAYAPGDARRYGFSSSASASTNVTALNNALLVGEIVTMPSGAFDIDSTIVVPSNRQLYGVSKGYGSNVSTVLRYTGAGVAILVGTAGSTVSGFYSHIADFTLKQAGTGTIGIQVCTTQFSMERVTVVPEASTGFSTAGIQTDAAVTTFTHIYRDVYVYGCIVGIDISRGNNFTLDHCFLESNRTNLRVGFAASVTNLAVTNGTVVELFGDGRAVETNTSINVDLYDVVGFSIRDCYMEINGSGTVAAAGQLGINLRSCKGGVIEANYLYGGGQATTIINAQASALDVEINGNAFVSVNGYGITEVGGARVMVGINAAPSPTTGVINRTHTPTPTGLTVVNGTGGASYAITWERSGKRVDFTLNITVTGTATTASTANTTYFAIPSPMPSPLVDDVCHAVSNTVDNYGTGLVSSSNSRIYTPTWSAANRNIAISGSYRCA